MDIHAKAEKLNLLEVDYKIYWRNLIHLKNAGKDIEQYQYYKNYGSTTMVYSNEYLNNHDIETLLDRDKKNEKIFNPNIFRRIKGKYDSFMLRRYIRKQR
ncbi:MULTISPECIES: hypothetical protein [unclassified Oceanobacillus]|uniref:hypothetical protein n=1 Tax=unclassified Oceanobacillus TaxID=2630292 RepID=UPI001BE6D4AA|nr:MULTISPECIES: hypothetical protein [unclassified Oceanobacillus]MBT2600962.1 hypothetical protein [Oceanobacillus sp. ISL-74]MBT2653587.1 hypothetical protein [Oceanobacillus sp. ISL-73]